MPSRRSSAATAPRSVQAAASRTMRSFSAAVKERLSPGFGTLSTDPPLVRADASGAAGAELESIDRRREGFGTGHVHSPPSLHRFREGACLTPRWHRGLRSALACSGQHSDVDFVSVAVLLLDVLLGICGRRKPRLLIGARVA